MKTTACIVSSLLISIPLLAHDGPKFSADFSLSVGSGSKTPIPGNSPSTAPDRFDPNTGYPFSLKTSITMPTTAAQEKGEKSDAGIEPSLAETYLKRLAESSKGRRKTIGVFSLAIGGAMSALGLALLSSEDESWFDFSGLAGSLFLISGGAFVVGGTYLLAVPGSAEREYTLVQGISDPAQRDATSQKALSSLAAAGKRNRIISGVISSALAAYILISSLEEDGSDGTLAASLFGASALNSFLRKSQAENMYSDYLEAGKQRGPFGARVGIRTYRGIEFVLSVFY